MRIKKHEKSYIVELEDGCFGGANAVSGRPLVDDHGTSY